MISPIDSLVDKVDYYEVCANIDILATQTLFVMEFYPYKVKITLITLIFELFSNLIPRRKNRPPNLNKGFIQPPCTLVAGFFFFFFFFLFFVCCCCFFLTESDECLSYS